MMKDTLKFRVKYTERNAILVSDTAVCHYQCVEVDLMSFVHYTFRKSVSVVKKELVNTTSCFSMNLR